ncbi:MAG TPA: VCBS repeat-containing protein, partial [Kofleriaceae bacterium]|nr:VCBS repeat-containing protein [Kofleriaceae bacterium]
MRTVLVLIAVAGCGTPHRDGNGGDGGSGSPDGPPVNKCKVTDDSNGVPNCTDVAPANSFDPDIQWTWMGPGGESNSIVTPLVANLTDDNGDGAIDLCDIPDVVVVASTGAGQPNEPGHIYLLNGQTGAQELMIPTTIDGTVTPALGDLDGDGVAEIVTVDTTGKLWAFHHDGSVMFGPKGQWAGDWYSGAIALADLDHDGHVEIIGGNTVFDDHGTVKWSAPSQQASWNASTAADLDGDGYMEVVLGAAAYHYDGTVYYNDTGVSPGYPQVANLDDDPEPEVLLTNVNGLSVIEHDGTIKYQDKRPTNDPVGFDTWLRPAT